MSHDVHFLERSVERLARPEMETALRLYKDPGLLRFILEKATIPGAADRVALCLSEERRGPFVIVTREGRFVTCLAEGMDLQNAHRLERAQIEALAARHERWLKRWRLANERTDEGRKLGHFIRRVTKGGLNVSREDIDAVAGWVPAIGGHLTCHMYEYLLERERLFKAVYDHCRKKRVEGVALNTLEWLWAAEHCMGHSLVILSNEDAFDGPEDGLEATLVFRGPWQSGCLAPAMQTAWAFGRMGKPWLKNVKAGYRNADSFTEFLTAMFGLIQVGLRHKGLREEVCKTLLSERPEAAWFWGLREYRDALVPLVRTVFDERAGQHDAQHLRDGRFWVGEYSKVNPALAARFPDAGSVPEEIARPAHLRFFFDTRANFVEMVAVGIKLQPWLARASLSDLYLPEEIVSIWQQAPSRKDLQDMGLSYYHAPLQKPVRKEKAPGRNDPCPCGSKKKYKKCCGSPEAAERAKAVEVRNGG